MGWGGLGARARAAPGNPYISSKCNWKSRWADLYPSPPLAGSNFHPYRTNLFLLTQTNKKNPWGEVAGQVNNKGAKPRNHKQMQYKFEMCWSVQAPPGELKLFFFLARFFLFKKTNKKFAHNFPFPAHFVLSIITPNPKPKPQTPNPKPQRGGGWVGKGFRCLGF